MEKKENLQSTGNSTAAHSSTKPVEEKLVACVKCKKQVKESTTVNTKKGEVCQECHAKLLKRQKMIKVLCGSAIVACLGGAGVYFASGDTTSNVKGFSGNTSITDSMSIKADSIKTEFLFE